MLDWFRLLKRPGKIRIVFAAIPAAVALLTFFGFHIIALELVGFRSSNEERLNALYEVAKCGTLVMVPNTTYSRYKDCGPVLEVKGVTIEKMLDDYLYYAHITYTKLRNDCGRSTQWTPRVIDIDNKLYKISAPTLSYDDTYTNNTETVHVIMEIKNAPNGLSTFIGDIYHECEEGIVKSNLPDTEFTVINPIKIDKNVKYFDLYDDYKTVIVDRGLNYVIAYTEFKRNEYHTCLLIPPTKLKGMQYTENLGLYQRRLNFKEMLDDKYVIKEPIKKGYIRLIPIKIDLTGFYPRDVTLQFEAEFECEDGNIVLEFPPFNAGDYIEK